MSKAVATFVQKVSLIWDKRWLFTSEIQETNVCIVGSKLLTTGTNVTTAKRKLNYSGSNGGRRSNTYMQAPFKRKT